MCESLKLSLIESTEPSPAEDASPSADRLAPDDAPAAPHVEAAAKIMSLLGTAHLPVEREELTTRAGIDDNLWTEVCRILVSRHEVVRVGTAKGPKYVTWEALLELLCAAISDADRGDGAGKSAILAAFLTAHGDPGDVVWSRAITELIAQRRVTREGERKGTRYRVVPAIP
jgi:hypothetical protein